MQAKVERQWGRLMGRRNRLLAGLQKWTPERLRARPVRGGWSALEVVDHLVRTEEEVLRMMEAARGTNAAVGLGDRVKAWMVLGVMWLPMRVAMPKAVERQVTPVAAEDLEALERRWKQVDWALRTRMEGMSDAECRAGVAKHPVSGWLDLGGGLRFLESHLVHHGYQLKRIEKGLEARAGAKSA